MGYKRQFCTCQWRHADRRGTSCPSRIRTASTYIPEENYITWHGSWSQCNPFHLTKNFMPTATWLVPVFITFERSLWHRSIGTGRHSITHGQRRSGIIRTEQVWGLFRSSIVNPLWDQLMLRAMIPHNRSAYTAWPANSVSTAFSSNGFPFSTLPSGHYCYNKKGGNNQPGWRHKIESADKLTCKGGKTRRRRAEKALNWY